LRENAQEDHAAMFLATTENSRQALFREQIRVLEALADYY
jgi:hypothetical protein